MAARPATALAPDAQRARGKRDVDMLGTCTYAASMTMIQVRNVPEALHRRLKSRAALQGKSLSDMVLAELEQLADSPTLAELEARLATLPPVDLSGGAASLIEQERPHR